MNTLETAVCVDAHLVLCAVVLSSSTLINVCDGTLMQQNNQTGKNSLGASIYSEDSNMCGMSEKVMQCNISGIICMLLLLQQHTYV